MYNIPELSFQSTQFGDYALVNYKKHEKYDGLYRSIIFKNKKVVCFSPPKSIPYAEFCEKHPMPTVTADEFLDGTMVNVFYDGETNEWVIATRSIVGANCTFYSQKTFHDMFHETNIDYSKLDKTYCYSFVLQHPDNQIVTPVANPALYLIAVYHITEIGITEVHSNNHCITSFLTPSTYTFSSYEEAEHFVQSQPYTFKGLMLKTGNERSKIRNLAYENVKKLRGNSACTLYTYLSIRSTPEQTEYEKYFPNHSFPMYEKQLTNLIVYLHSLYMDCFIKRVKPLKQYEAPFKQHLYELHMDYLHHLRQEKKCVTRHEVKKYVVSLPTAVTVTLISALSQR
jgi:hypothetical protein|uniref:T4 RNA ligase 1-like N-terminal domain-containing protein n=1 Tax=viral metagenome TaxID=1070528 RepID=A0A6C0B937_9ZZZZ